MNNINFTQVATDEKIPGYYGEISTINANEGLYTYPTKVLLVGQRIANGSPVAELSKNIIVDRKQAQELFGQGSQLALMCEYHLGIQDSVEIHAIPQDDLGASATAAGSIVVAATATESGTLYLYIAGKRLQIGISSDDTDAEIATAITAAIQAEKNLPVTAAVNGVDDTKVDITAKNAGLCGNEIKIVTNHYTGERLPASLDLTITQLTGGTSNPDISDVFDVIEGDWFTDWAIPYTDTANLALIEAELKERYTATGKMDAHFYIGYRGTYSEVYTFYNARNSALGSGIDVPTDALEPAWLWAAGLTAWGAFWSNQHPARPYKGLVMKGFKVPPSVRTRTERRVLLGNGCTTWTVNANGEVVLERMVTMYQANDGGIEDETWLDITTPKTFSHIRYDHNAYITTLYFGADGKVLTENEHAAARSDILVTSKTIAASSKARSELWIERGLVSELLDIKAEVDGDDPTRVNMMMSLDITNPLMILATKLDMRI